MERMVLATKVRALRGWALGNSFRDNIIAGVRDVKGIPVDCSFVEVISVIVNLPAGSYEPPASAAFARAGAPFLRPPGRELTEREFDETSWSRRSAVR
jgi:hypothetical protein